MSRFWQSLALVAGMLAGAVLGNLIGRGLEACIDDVVYTDQKLEHDEATR